eukprot:2867444-Rhodomonas_salina.2
MQSPKPDDWDSASIDSFLKHYGRYDFMDPVTIPRHLQGKYAYMTPDLGVASEGLKLCDCVDAEMERLTAPHAHPARQADVHAGPETDCQQHQGQGLSCGSRYA